MLSPRQLLAPLPGALMMSAPVVAEAQEAAEAPAAEDSSTAEDTARARALFSEGVELAAEGQYRDAATRFRAAYGFRAAPSIAYNLAAALVELDELLEASELVHSVQGDPESSEEILELAGELEVRIEQRLARLTVTADGDHAGVTIGVDARQLSEGELGVPIPINPGTHTVTAERGESVLERQEAMLAVGGSASVALSPATWPAEAVVLDPEPEAASGGGSLFTKSWFWTIAGVVVLGAVIGIAAAAAGGGVEDPVQGDTTPAALTF